MPLCALDPRGISQRPFREQSRGRTPCSRLTTSDSQQLSTRNAGGYRLCVVAMTSEWRTLALALRNHILQGPSHHIIAPGSLYQYTVVLNCPVYSFNWAGSITLFLGEVEDSRAYTPVGTMTI